MILNMFLCNTPYQTVTPSQSQTQTHTRIERYPGLVSKLVQIRVDHVENFSMCFSMSYILVLILFTCFLLKFESDSHRVFFGLCNDFPQNSLDNFF